MNVNVYNEEVTDRVELRDKTPENAPTVVFTGIQFFVGPTIKHTPNDDDSARVVFWYSDEHTRTLLKTAFTKALKLLEENPPK